MPKLWKNPFPEQNNRAQLITLLQINIPAELLPERLRQNEVRQL